MFEINKDVRHDGFNTIIFTHSNKQRRYEHFLAMKRYYDIQNPEEKMPIEIKDAVQKAVEGYFCGFIEPLASQLGLEIRKKEDWAQATYLRNDGTIDVFCEPVALINNYSLHLQPTLTFNYFEGLAAMCSFKPRGGVVVRETIPLLAKKSWPFRKALVTDAPLDCEIMDFRYSDKDNSVLEVRPLNAIPMFLKITQAICGKFSLGQFEKITETLKVERKLCDLLSSKELEKKEISSVVSTITEQALLHLLFA